MFARKETGRIDVKWVRSMRFNSKAGCARGISVGGLTGVRTAVQSGRLFGCRTLKAAHHLWTEATEPTLGR